MPSIPTSDSFFAQSFYLYSDGATLDSLGWTPVGGTPAGSIVVAPNGCIRQNRAGPTVANYLPPTTLSMTKYSVTFRIHQYDTTAISYVGATAWASATAATGYLFDYNVNDGMLECFRLDGATNPSIISTPANFGNGNDGWVRLTIDDTDPTHVLVSLFYSLDGYTYTQVGSTYTDTSPPPSSGRVAISTGLPTTDSTGVSLGDFIVSPSATWQTSTFNTPIGGQPCVLLRPNGDNPATSLPLCIYIHGSGGSSQDIVTGTAFKTLYGSLQAVMSLPARIVACDAHGNNWGNQTSLNDIEEAISIVRTTYATSKLVILSGSMGGMDTGNLFTKGSLSNCVTVYSWYPAFNLANMYAGSLQSQITTAYGIDGTHPYATQTAGYDPILNPGSVFGGSAVTWRFTASPGDNTVNKAANADQFTALIQSYARSASVLITQGDHGDLSNFVPEDVWLTFSNGYSYSISGPTVTITSAGTSFSGSQSITLSVSAGTGSVTSGGVTVIGNGTSIVTVTPAIGISSFTIIFSAPGTVTVTNNFGVIDVSPFLVSGTGLSRTGVLENVHLVFYAAGPFSGSITATLFDADWKIRVLQPYERLIIDDLQGLSLTNISPTDIAFVLDGSSDIEVGNLICIMKNSGSTTATLFAEFPKEGLPLPVGVLPMLLQNAGGASNNQRATGNGRITEGTTQGPRPNWEWLLTSGGNF